MKGEMKLWIPMFCVCGMMLAAGCGKTTPGEVAVKVYEGVRDNKPKVIQANCTESTAELFQMLGGMAASELKGAKIKAIDTKIDGDNATVVLEITGEDGSKRTEDLTLVKVKGNWKADVKK